jgi:endo-1,4-beta-D-glucanase Y
MPNYSSAMITPRKGEDPIAYEERQRKEIQKDYESLISYRTYKTWLLAMITKNKQEDLHYSEEVAKALKQYRADAKKRDRANLIDNELLQAKTKKQFLDCLATLIKDVDQESLDTFKTLRDKVHLMTAEDFGYFVVLLKFDYAYQEKKS